jgi:hypothetical protein
MKFMPSAKASDWLYRGPDDAVRLAGVPNEKRVFALMQLRSGSHPGVQTVILDLGPKPFVKCCDEPVI